MLFSNYNKDSSDNVYIRAGLSETPIWYGMVTSTLSI